MLPYGHPTPPEPIHNRKDTHGPYKMQFECAQRLKQIYRASAQGDAWAPVYLEAAEMILLKLSRIATGDPTFADHWEDIAGYAMRVIGK